MDFRTVIALLILSLIFSCRGILDCEPDIYGTNVLLNIPVTVELPGSDTISVGDTIKVVFNFSNEVEVIGGNQSALLEGFNFYTEISLSEISGTEENFNVMYSISTQEGDLELLPLDGTFAFLIDYVEINNFYRFSASIVVEEAGKYFISFGTSLSRYERDNHPFVFECNQQRRNSIRIEYDNPLTSEEEFENVFRSSPIDYFQTIYDFERYKKLGARSFVVVEE